MTLFDRNDHLPLRGASAQGAVRAFEATQSHANIVALNFAKSPRRAERLTQKKTFEPVFRIPAMTGHKNLSSWKPLAAAIVLSAVCHGGLIAASLMDDSNEQFGTVSEKTDAFSLSMEQSVVLESISTDRTQAAAAAVASTQAGSVQSVESKPQEMAEVKNDPLSDEPPPKPVNVADVTPTAVAPTDDPLPVIRGGGELGAVSEIKADQIAETEVKEMPDAVETKEDAPAKAERKKEIEKEKKNPQAESHAQAAGSTSSFSNVQAAVNGRASASQGNALTYGAQVRAKLLHNKPVDNALRGTVLVSFGIAADGGLRYLRLSESSGNATLDNVAISMVQKAVPFDQPPSELSPTQLSYAISIKFFN